jgi:hypothetical protein
LGQKFLPAQLATGKVLLSVKVLKSAVVSVDIEFGAKEIRPPFFECTDYGKQFLFMYRVVLFS